MSQHHDYIVKSWIAFGSAVAICVMLVCIAAMFNIWQDNVTQRQLVETCGDAVNVESCVISLSGL